MPVLRYTFDELANPELAGKTIELDTDILMLDEAEDLEKVTGEDIKVLHELFLRDKTPGIRAFVWLATRRAGFTIKYSELAFNIKKTIMAMAMDEDPVEEAAPTAPLDRAETDPVSVPT